MEWQIERSSQLRIDQEGKEVKKMKYRRPEVSSLGNAASAIQGSKNDPTKNDGQQTPHVGTTNAYEADE